MDSISYYTEVVIRRRCSGNARSGEEQKDTCRWFGVGLLGLHPRPATNTGSEDRKAHIWKRLGADGLAVATTSPNLCLTLRRDAILRRPCVSIGLRLTVESLDLPNSSTMSHLSQGPCATYSHFSRTSDLANSKLCLSSTLCRARIVGL